MKVIFREYKLSRVPLDKRFRGYKLSRTPKKSKSKSRKFIPAKMGRFLQFLANFKGKSTRAKQVNLGWLDLQIMDPQGQIGQKIFPCDILAISSRPISLEVCMPISFDDIEESMLNTA